MTAREVELDRLFALEKDAIASNDQIAVAAIRLQLERLVDDEQEPQTSTRLKAARAPAAPPTPRLEWLGAKELSALAREFVARLKDGREAPVPTGHAQLDEQLDGGFWPGLHIFCGGTGAMKTQLALSTAINAARAGTPVAVIALEQRRAAWAARVQAELTELSWSSVLSDRANTSELARYDATEWPELLSLIPGRPYRFPIEGAAAVTAELRRRHPTGQLLVIADYVQLIGDIGANDETRARVMRAAVAAQEAAHEHNAAVLLLSSVARENYAKLADLPCKPSMLATRDTPLGPVRELKSAHAWIGLGKESGEIEFSAESVTVVAKGQHAEIPGASVVVAATAKRRFGDPSWCAFRAERGRLYAAPDYRLRTDADGVDAAEAGVNRDAILAACDRAIMDALAEHPAGLSKNGVRESAKGQRKEMIDGRLAYLEEIAGSVRSAKRTGPGGGRIYKLADPEYRKRYEQEKEAKAAQAAPTIAPEQTGLEWLENGGDES